MWRFVGALIISLVLQGFTLAAHAQPLDLCVGDCDADGRVSINELVVGAGVALGQQSLTACVAFDSSRDAEVVVAELIQGVRSALEGCSPLPLLFGDVRSWCVGQTPDWVALVDLNGDTVADVVTVNRESADATVRLGDGAGGFEAARSFPVGDDPRDAALSDEDGDGVGELPDVDADGFGDLVVAVRGGRSVSLLRGLGDGTFAPAQTIAIPDSRPHAVAVADLDGDGGSDAVVASASPGQGDVRVVFGLQAGTAAALFANDEPRDVAVADVDGDDALDIIATNVDSNDVSVLLGMGDGGFAAPLSFAAGDGPRRLAVGDIDGDGMADVAAVNQRSDDISVLRNTGGGAFGDALHYPVGTNPRFVTLADFNGDGALDAAVANRGGDSLSILATVPETGLMQLVQTIDLLPGTCDGEVSDAGPRGVAIADWNGDGVLDLITANAGNDSVSIASGLAP